MLNRSLGVIDLVSRLTVWAIKEILEVVIAVLLSTSLLLDDWRRAFPATLPPLRQLEAFAFSFGFVLVALVRSQDRHTR